ncbi:hypothetical protein RN001_004188 [Aquatica leii]|uniref:Uncharacterized protein n=1 Tax=Aquatica leii TaxID=1421715 RepID=A0AAN7PB22_9COLE|nr:hypothetical protein RN001_004188 [Aquatica leii]
MSKRHKTKPNKNKCTKFCFLSIKSAFRRHPKKRKKPNRWINLHSSFESSKSKTKTFNIEDRFLERSVYDIDSSSVCNQEIVNTFQLSPVLKYSTFERESPVIGNKDRIIKESTFVLDTEQCKIEFADQSTVVSNTINEFFSQDCSRISPIKISDEIINVEQNLYYEAPRKQNKPFKKDGLAYSLQMALLRRNAEVSIWKHELELEANITKHENLFLVVKVKQSYKQFCVLVLECEDLNKENCLVILGSDATTHACTDINSNIKIYKPYLQKHIKHNDNFITCYFNVSKIMNC